MCKLFKHITINEYGECEQCEPSTVCGKCVKFNTYKCEFNDLKGEDEAAPEDCFEAKVKFINNEEFAEDINVCRKSNKKGE